MRLLRAPLALICLLAVASFVAGCGDDSDSSGDSGSEIAKSRPAPPKSDFPSARGKTLAEVLNSADGPSEYVVSPAARVFYRGENRYSFGVFRRDGKQITDAEIALYFARVPKPRGRAARDRERPSTTRR